MKYMELVNNMVNDHDIRNVRAVVQEDAIGRMARQELVEAGNVMCQAANVGIVEREGVGENCLTVRVKEDVLGEESGPKAINRIRGQVVVVHIMAPTAIDTPAGPGCSLKGKPA